MTAINFGTMRTRVARNLGHMPATHERYAEIDDWINEGANRLIRHSISRDHRAVNNFPELKDRRWVALTQTTTDAAQGPNWIALPDTVLILEGVTYTKLSAAYDPATQRGYPSIEETDAQRFELFDKAATGWPVQWHRNGNRIEYWRTTTATYVTRLVLHGVKKEQALTQDASVFVMSDSWHPAIIKCATAIALENLEWDGSEKWWGAVDRDVTAVINPVGMEGVRNQVPAVTVAGSL